MSERTERDVLNRLIEACRDGEHAFRFAADHVARPDVKSLFLDIASQHQRFAADLLPQAQRLGGASEARGRAAGALHRGWMTLKETLSGFSEHAVIGEAERDEEAAEAIYRDALEGMLPPPSRDLIEKQYAAIQLAHARIHGYRLQWPRAEQSGRR